MDGRSTLCLFFDEATIIFWIMYQIAKESQLLSTIAVVMA